jgi:tricarballylate dehydrogenase
VLGKGYLAGIGVTIGTAFGRIAGTSAANAALAPVQPKNTEGALSAA